MQRNTQTSVDERKASEEEAPPPPLELIFFETHQLSEEAPPELPPEPLGQAATLSLLELLEPPKTTETSADLPPPVTPFDRPGKTIAETLTSVQEVERNEASLDSAYSAEGKICSVSPSDPPVPGEFGYQEGDSEQASGVQRLSSQITIKYSAPMIQLGAELEPFVVEADGPIEEPPRWVPKLTPLVAGKWIWLDPATLQFEVQNSFARATTFKVQAPCGSRWRFTTEPPKISFFSSSGRDGLFPVLNVSCDLEVDWVSQLQLFTLEDKHGAGHLIRLVEVTKNYREWTAKFTPVKALERDTKYRFKISSGLVSKAGPNPLTECKSFTFRTYGDFKLKRHSHRRESFSFEESATWSFHLEFSNPFPDEPAQIEAVKVEPPLDDMEVRIYSNTIHVKGRSPGGLYRITPDPELVDLYGQQLGFSEPLHIELRRPQELLFPGNRMCALQGHRSKVFTFFSLSYRGLFIRIQEVKAEDWPQFLEHKSQHRRGEFSVEGQTGFVEFEDNYQIDRVDVDLSPYLKGESGHLVVQVRPLKAPEWKAIEEGVEATYEQISRISNNDEWQSCWVQICNLSVSHFTNFQSFAWNVIDSKTGKPVSAESEFLKSDYGSVNLIRYKSESVLLPTRCSRVERKPTLRGYVFTDRGLYQPGETVTIKGWFWEEAWPGAPRTELPECSLSYEVRTVGSTIEKGETTLTRGSSTHLAFKLPSDVKLGAAYIFFTAPSGTQFLCDFQIQEFRRPKFEVQIECLDEKQLDYFVRAESFSGSPIREADVHLKATLTPANYRPPGWSQFRFGFFTNIWRYFGTSLPESQTNARGKLQEDGSCSCRLNINQKQEGRSYSIELISTVVDIDNQAQTSQFKHLIHASQVFLGLRLSKRVFGPNDTIEVQYVVVDSEGSVIPDQLIEIRLKDEESHFLTSGDRPQVVVLKTERKGHLEIQGQVRDEGGDPHFTRVSFYRLGCPVFPASELAFPLLLDKEEYAVGDEGTVTFFADHKGTATLRLVRGEQKVLKHQFCEAGENTMVFQVTEDLRDSCKLYLDFVGPDAEGHFQTYQGEKEFGVSSLDKELSVEILTSKQRLGPGAELEVSLKVKDPQGRPAKGAEVALLVVDEAVLFAGGYRIPEPFHRLYPQQQDATFSDHLWQIYKMPDLKGLFSTAEQQRRQMMRACSMAGPAGAAEESFFAPRSDFSPLAHFSPNLETDENGEVGVTFRMPESLSKFRLTAVVLTEDRSAGYAESQVQVTRPLLIEPCFPRFLSRDDETELPVTVRNQTPRTLEVEVGLLASGLNIRAPQALLVRMPPGSSRIVSFIGEVKDVDEARIRSVVRYGQVGDAVESMVPVQVAATTETVAACGELVNEGIAFPVTWPSRALPDFGGLAVELSTTALQGLDGAYRYILRYPFECTEQLASRIAATAALRSYLDEFQPAEVPSSQERDVLMKEWMSDLLCRHEGRGFRFWSFRDARLSEFPSLFAHHALILAHQSGYDLGEYSLQQIRTSLAEHPVGEGSYGKRLRTFLASYRLWLQYLCGEEENLRMDLDAKHADLDAWLFLLQCQPGRRIEGLRVLQNSITETATTASLVPEHPYLVRYSFGSQQRSNAWALSALLKVDPENPLVPKLAKGLQAHRVQGRWRNTQENIFSILALADYFRAREAVVPNLRAGAWIGRKQFAGRFFRGREQTRHRWSVEAQAVRNSSPSEVVIESKGEGRLYHRTELSWAVGCAELKSLHRGFEISRSYKIVEGEGECSGETLSVEAGSKIRVTLNIRNTGPRYHVALVDPYPAGFEPLNPRLASTEPTRVDSYGFPFYQMRTHQVEAFADYLHSGRHSFSYEVRATTRGRFQLRAAKIEEMYSPETFGHTDGRVVVIR